MVNKVIIAIAVLLVAVLGLFLAFASDNSLDNGERTVLNVSSEGPYELSKLTDDIKTGEYYKGYDNETLSWMESLGDKYVWFSDDEIVIMDKWDSDKIPSAYVCDAYFQEIFSCKVIEKHPLGNTQNPKDVLLVKNVDYIKEEVHDTGLA